MYHLPLLKKQKKIELFAIFNYVVDYKENKNQTFFTKLGKILNLNPIIAPYENTLPKS